MASASACFHCGDVLPQGDAIVARLQGQDRAMCCLGCKAAAEFIAASGLQAFYDFRSKPEAELKLPPGVGEWRHFDGTDLLNRYVSCQADHAESTIDIGGMYCSACVWLLEKALRQLPAVNAVDINPAVRRAVVRWNISELDFSALLAAIARLGFKPAPVSAAGIAPDANREYRLALKRLIVAGACGMQVMMFAVALYAGDHFGIDATMQKFLRWISLLVSLPIVSFAARPFFTAAWRGLQLRTPGMDLPVSLAIVAAFSASFIATWANRGAVYFDSVAMFVFFLSATRYLEMRSRHRSGDHATALAQLLPDTAVRLGDAGVETIALDRLRVHDTISIRPGDVLPADGEVLSGRLSLDESMLSGESMPVTRQAGDPVFAGAMVSSGSATLRVTHVGASTSLAEIGRMIDRAKADRPPIALLADRIAANFVLAVIALALVSAAAWWWIDPSRAFSVALATLVVTCPCALALATPAAVAAATSGLARSGLLLVHAGILEVLCRPAIMLFDKTGTLTEGRPVVLHTRLLAADTDEQWVLQAAAALESISEHVLARAFAPYQNFDSAELGEAHISSGCGVEADYQNRRLRIGSAQFVAELNGQPAPVCGGDARTQVFLGDDKQILAQFTIGDELRSDASDVITAIHSAGFRVLIASGDHETAVQQVATQLGVSEWHSGLTPADKLQLVKDLRLQGLPVVMVGDGINDAPVLAAADASIALDAGTALARASADAVALGRKLGSIWLAIDMARRTQRVIRQNISWAILYNATAVPLAVSGLLAPWMAAIGMSASSLLVVLNALRLQRI